MELSMNNKSKIENNIMHDIRKGKMHMKPKWYYVVIAFLWIILIGLFSFISIYIFSIISFWVRISFAKGPAYGAKQNLSTLISNFPWWLALLGIVTLALVIYLVRKHSNLYKVRLAIVVPITVLILLTTSLLLSYCDLPIFNIVHSQNYGHNNR